MRASDKGRAALCRPSHLLQVEVQIEQALACLTQSMNLSKTERWQAVQHLAAARKMLAEEEQFNDSL